LLAGLRSERFSPRLAVIPDGEAHKTLKTVQTLYIQCLKSRLDRRSALVALGGGVVGDMTGFAAATYMRGIPFVQCPTTLLSMVDASIGGKTGVDLPEGKNLVGAFWQPRRVWMDLSVLKTLPDREWRTGVAEVIKYGLMADEGILRILESIDLAELRRRADLQEDIVSRSARIKARIVSEDEKETSGRRELLNLGHTFGHAIESVSGYKTYTHGEAISIGMAAAARLSVRLKTFRSPDVRRLELLFQRWGLPVRARRPLPRKRIWEAMSRDKKAFSGRFRFIVPLGRGRARAVTRVPFPLLNQTLKEVGL
jgi:3-dehydroquinate synthase